MLSLIKASKGGSNFLIFIFWQFMLVFVFAFIYWLIANGKKCPDKDNNCEFYGLGSHSTLLDFLYYSLTTQTTVGTGDIIPTSKIARSMAMLQMSMMYIGIGITESRIMHIIKAKKVWQPSLVLLFLLIAAFAPPIITVIVRVFTKGGSHNNTNKITQKFVKIPLKIQHQV